MIPSISVAEGWRGLGAVGVGSAIAGGDLCGGPVSSSRRPKEKPVVSQRRVHAFVHGLFGEDMHAGRVGALAKGVSGVLEAGQLGMHAIGRGLAAVQGLVDKHATQQVDRLIGNEKLDPVVLSEAWTRTVLSSQDGFVFVNLDWTVSTPTTTACSC